MRLTYALLACADDEGRVYTSLDDRVRRIAFSAVPPNVGPFLWVVRQESSDLDDYLVERAEADDNGDRFYRLVGYEKFNEEIKRDALAFAQERDREAEATAGARCYLKVHFLHKEIVRGLGFRWDASVRAWWYPTDPANMYADVLKVFPLLDPQPHESTWGGSFIKKTDESVASTRT